MNHPALLYYAALLLVGVPASFRVRLALIGVVLGALSCVALLAGVLGPGLYLALHIMALTAGIFLCPAASRCMLATVLFVDMAIVDCIELAGLFSRHDGWWARYWLVLAQLALFLPDAADGYLRAFRFVSTQRPEPGGLHFASS